MCQGPPTMSTLQGRVQGRVAWLDFSTLRLEILNTKPFIRIWSLGKPKWQQQRQGH